MKKQLVHVLLNHDTYVYLRSQNANISELLRNLATAYTKDKNIDKPKERIIKEKEFLQNQVNELTEKIGLLNMQLLALKEKEDEDDKEKLQQRVAMTRAMKDSGLFADMLPK